MIGKDINPKFTHIEIFVPQIEAQYLLVTVCISPKEVNDEVADKILKAVS